MSRVSNNDMAARSYWRGCIVECPSTPTGEPGDARTSVIDGFGVRLRWSLGDALALVRVWLHPGCKHSSGEERRLGVCIIAAYHFLFPLTLIGLLTWQLPHITEPWKSAIPALIICYAVAALPAVFGLGLMLRDEGVRVGTIASTILDLFLNIEYIQRGVALHPELTSVRISADLLIILLLSRQSLRRHFAQSPLALHLTDESLATHERETGRHSDSTCEGRNV